MTTAATATGDTTDLSAIEHALATGGVAGAIERLVEAASRRDDPRVLLDALLLKARQELGLPLIALGTLADLPEPARTHYEDRYVDALREVGTSLLNRGQITAAWPYFRTIGEKEPIARAMEQTALESGDERVSALIDVALYQGAHPRHGFQLVLDHHGTCSAISAFESLPPDNAIREACARSLLRTLHSHLAANLRAEITRQGHGRPSEDAPIPALLAGRDWLFADEAYHIDISHLASVVRMSTLLTDRADLNLALELCEYGRRLGPRLRYDDAPPFERTYEDHAAYLKALLGREVEESIAHFKHKLETLEAGSDEALLSAQAIVGLLARLGRLDEAIDVAAEHLAAVPEGLLSCPSLPQLCQRAGRLDRLADISRERGQLVSFTAALLQSRGLSSSDAKLNR